MTFYIFLKIFLNENILKIDKFIILVNSGLQLIYKIKRMARITP